MASCHDMKEGDVFTCETCGLQLKVKKGCTNCCSPNEECDCSFKCCGNDLIKKA